MAELSPLRSEQESQRGFGRPINCLSFGSHLIARMNLRTNFPLPQLQQQLAVCFYEAQGGQNHLDLLHRIILLVVEAQVFNSSEVTIVLRHFLHQEGQSFNLQR